MQQVGSGRSAWDVFDYDVIVRKVCQACQASVTKHTQENVNVNHIMPPAPPVDVVEDDEGSSSKLTLADNTIKPPDPPVPVVAPASWNKLQIESEVDEEEDLGEVGENTAQKNNIEFSMTGATDLDGLD